MGKVVGKWHKKAMWQVIRVEQKKKGDERKDHTGKERLKKRISSRGKLEEGKSDEKNLGRLPSFSAKHVSNTRNYHFHFVLSQQHSW